MDRAFARAFLVLLVALVTGVVAAQFVDRVRLADHPELAVAHRLPHAVPKHPGEASFRFAMVHDVLHERYPKHGPAHYERRNELTRTKLAALAPDDPAAFPLADDLGVGLSRLGRNAEAATLLREKLKRQQAKGLTGRDLYTSYANLGTFLMLDSLGRTAAGDPAAKATFRESVDLIRKSVEVNPESHFGREQWQLVFGEFILAAADKPELLRTFDFIGNRLGDEPLPWSRRAGSVGMFVPVVPDDLTTVHADWAKSLRGSITQVGAEHGWQDVPVPSLRKKVAFDEPCLGIVGMWRQGGGPNPFFALCLGETMLRVGQRYIAWAAFERAARMADRYWPDPATQQFLREHCADRQKAIEQTLPAAEVADLRPRFDAELAYGEGYQREYQKYEAAKLAAGVPLDGPHFWDEFERGREPIASPSGPEEWSESLDTGRARLAHTRDQFAWGLLGGGVIALLLAAYLRLRG